MDLTPTPEQHALRDEIREWLNRHPPWSYGELGPRYKDLTDEIAAGRHWQGVLAAGRWVGVTWPTRYGGRGEGALSNFIVQEELARAGAPELVGRIGINLVGPTLLAHGTDEQRDLWLERILGAQDLWCQLFSEPDAGSDLAAVATRAVRADNGWLVTGQKVWTSYAQFADWGVCLARSDPDAPKRRGITYLVVDMHDPGVEIRPLRQITGEDEFNEVFLTDVFVPDSRVIGEPGQGWQVANSTLSHERGVNPRQLVIHLQLLEGLWRMAEERGALDDARLAARLADAYVGVRIFQLHNWRSLSRIHKGADVGPEGSALKLYWSEMSQRLHATAMAVLGDDAPMWQGAHDLHGDGRWQRSWLYYRAASIFAGTNEIQRNIIGERVMSLPRDPTPMS